MGKVIGESYAKIAAYLEEQGELTTDVPFVMYYDFENIDEAAVQMTIGFKTARALPGKEDIKPLQLPAQKIVSCLHRGAYPELADIYREMSEWIKSKGHQASGTSVEYYYTGPAFPENEHVTMVEMSLSDKI
jgi:effector-binding domain-containing protein